MGDASTLSPTPIPYPYPYRRLLSPMGDAFTLLHAHDAWVEARGTGEDGRRWCPGLSAPTLTPSPSPSP